MSHPISIAPVPGRVVVRWRGRIVVETTHALELREASYPPVLYLPREDADMSAFERTTRQTTCPFKGVANYFTLRAEGAHDDNAVWTYETPKVGVEAIREHLAFYPDKVEIAREPA
jgi:uncharacterized protein (DUF427 family)